MKRFSGLLTGMSTRFGHYYLIICGTFLLLSLGTLLSVFVISIFSIIVNFLTLNSFYVIRDAGFAINIAFEFVLLFAIIFLLLLFTSTFLITLKVLSNLEFLPHMYSNTSRRRFLTLTIIPLYFAVFVQIFLTKFSVFSLISLSIPCSLLVILLFMIYLCTGVFLRYRSKRIAKIESSKIDLLTLLFLTIILLTIIFAIFIFRDFINILVFEHIFSYFVAFVVIIFMNAIKSYYTKIHKKLSVNLDDIYLSKPSSAKPFVLVARFNKPAIKAISYAKAVHSNAEILSIVNKETDSSIERDHEKARISLPLRLIVSTNSDYSADLVKFIEEYRKLNSVNSNSGLVIIYLPHYCAKHWWELFLHNREVDRMIRALDRLQGVVICSVPYQDSE